MKGRHSYNPISRSRIKKELDDERAEYKQTQNQMIQDKDALMSLEVKVSLLESENMTKDLKTRDLELLN